MSLPEQAWTVHRSLLSATRAVEDFWKEHRPEDCDLELAPALVMVRCAQEPHSVSVLHQEIGLSVSRISRITTKLRGQGMILAETDAHDNRRLSLTVAPKYQQLVEECEHTLMLLHEKLQKTLGEGATAALAAQLWAHEQALL
jgi:DNA-binding MarR family transcriptional regulator